MLLLEYPRKCLREMYGPCEMICTIGNVTKRSISRIKVSDLPFVINWSISCALIGASHSLQDNTVIHGLQRIGTQSLTALQIDIS